ncbi:hypothetical protein BWP39_16980 [Paraburkholderia acidicola]|uniref:Uncharacterized protein n=1 Tax=Paraburkholderia acidicola TaxID=1912599 RepID=A0A2A4F1J0_9BURK|nr:hypothetical protein BWP39_16980 [Paraburkholderia acidicola]
MRVALNQNGCPAVIQITQSTRISVRKAVPGSSEMEKWVVIAGIWAMCALCAIFFIRGATCSATRREAEREARKAPARLGSEVSAER